MPEQTKPAPGKEEQAIGAPEAQGHDNTARILANARRAMEASAAPVRKMDEDRELFVLNAQPVADALRKSGKPAEAKQLEEAAQAVHATKGLGPEVAGRKRAVAGEAPEEKSLKDVMAGIFATIDKDPALRALPATQALRKASDSLEGAGMLNITVRGGVIASFASNFADNFGRTHKLAQAAEGPAPHVVSTPQQLPPPARRGDAGPSAAMPVPTAAPLAAASPAVDRMAPAGPSAPAATAAPKPEPPAAKQASPAPVAPTPAPIPAPTPTPGAARTEVLYTAAPPDSEGLLSGRVLKEQPAHNALFRLVVDAKDPNRAILLPAPGAEDRIKNSLHDALDNAYALRALPEASKPHLVVEAPTQLTRTEAGWRVTEKGSVSFSETPVQYEAKQAAPAAAVPAPAPSIAPALAPPAAQVAQPGSYSRADIPEALLAKLGVPVSELQRTGQLDKLLTGQKTDLIQGFALTGQSGEPVLFAAKLVLQRDADGVATLKIDLPKHNLVIPKEVMGKEITPVMQAELQQNGVLPLTTGFRDAKGQPFTAYLAIDKEMNRVVAVRPQGINIPKEVLGVQLAPPVRRQLLEGKAAALVGMTNSRNQAFDATVQLDPVKRQLTFREVRPHQVTEQIEPTRRRGLHT
ncbi:MAG: DUF3945 domain-containing protein [Janthinobacterium lividum]